MCDQEVRTRFRGIELQLTQIAVDVRWLKKIIGGMLVILAAAVGIDITGLV